MKCFMSGRECDYITERESGLFMLSPFGFPFDDLYDHAVKPCLKRLGYKIDRADKTLQLGYVMCQRICRPIQTSEYVLADLSVPNANVYYELGLAYGLGKKIVVVYSTQTPHDYQGIFQDEANISSAFVPYATMNDLRDENTLSHALSNPIHLDEHVRLRASTSIFMESSNPILLNIEDGMTPLAGLQEATVGLVISSDALAATWHVQTVRLDTGNTARMIVDEIKDAKICVTDTTHYQSSTNMYMYFLLGLAHGFQKEVVPIINATLNKDVPFDIHGLWQIYFSRIEELEKWLKDVLPKAEKSIETQQRDYLYKQLWSPFMETRRSGHGDEKKSLHVMTCARNTRDEDRGDRTNLDKNDFMTVADLSFFVGETFEYAKVQIEPPTSKKTIADLTTQKEGKWELNKHAVERLREGMIEEFNRLKGNWIIIGAPDSSDYSEVVLAHAHHIEPYAPEQSKAQLPFVFVKERTDYNPLNVSSFYDPPSDGHEMILWKGEDRFDCREWQAGEERRGVTHGVITILNRAGLGQKVSESKKFMVFSGFTGIATYAMLEIVTDEKYKDQYTKLLENYGALHAQDKNVNILVTAEYRYKKVQMEGPKEPGDTREITSIQFVDIQEIDFEPRDSTGYDK